MPRRQRITRKLRRKAWSNVHEDKSEGRTDRPALRILWEMGKIEEQGGDERAGTHCRG